MTAHQMYTTICPECFQVVDVFMEESYYADPIFTSCGCIRTQGKCNQFAVQVSWRVPNAIDPYGYDFNLAKDRPCAEDLDKFLYIGVTLASLATVACEGSAADEKQIGDLTIFIEARNPESHFCCGDSNCLGSARRRKLLARPLFLKVWLSGFPRKGD